jgi:hypothetical protein
VPNQPSRLAVVNAARSGMKMLAMVESLRRLPCSSSSASQSTKRASWKVDTSTSFNLAEK